MLKSFIRSKYTKTLIEHFEKPKNVIKCISLKKVNKKGNKKGNKNKIK